jgi:hypothetical protein
VKGDEMTPNCVTCKTCKHRGICKWYAQAIQYNFPRGAFFTFRSKTLSLWFTLLPEWCNEYEKEPPVEPLRDKNGVLLTHKPLKLWYPNQNIEEEKADCDCWHCQGGQGQECFRKAYGDYSWKGMSYKI